MGSKSARRRRKANRKQKKAKADRLKASGIEVGYDPVYRKLEEKYKRAMVEIGQLKAVISSAESEHKEVVADEKAKIDEAQQRYTKAELDGMRHAANIDMEEQVQSFIGQLRQRADVVLSGKKISYEPEITDTIVIGQYAISFERGVERRYTREAIAIYENRQRQLAEYREMKTAFGATPMGQAVRPMEAPEFAKVLESHR